MPVVQDPRLIPPSGGSMLRANAGGGLAGLGMGGYRGPNPVTTVGRGGTDFSGFPGAMGAMPPGMGAPGMGAPPQVGQLPPGIGGPMGMGQPPPTGPLAVANGPMMQMQQPVLPQGLAPPTMAPGRVMY